MAKKVIWVNLYRAGDDEEENWWTEYKTEEEADEAAWREWRVTALPVTIKIEED